MAGQQDKETIMTMPKRAGSACTCCNGGHNTPEMLIDRAVEALLAGGSTAAVFFTRKALNVLAADLDEIGLTLELDDSDDFSQLLQKDEHTQDELHTLVEAANNIIRYT